MSLTISLNQQTMDALIAEAASRAISCEQVASEMLESYFTPAFSPDAEYDAWFRAKVEEGRLAAREGRIHSNEEVEQIAEIRRRKLRAQIADQQ